MKLNIADNLSLPLDFVTERIAFLARTGAGKSGGMRVLAEEMVRAKQFFIFLDPKGDAWGIRSDYGVLIMGGEHQDVPLEPRAGSFVADFLVGERISTVLDLSEFTESEMVRFTADFGERFYRTNREAVHWFIDEADEFAPQSGYNAEALKCLGAIQRIQRRGRGRGIGVTLASQRSAVINKSVLTQAGTLIAMQTTAPHDMKAVDAWLEYAATKEARNLIMAELPGMQPREAFVYSPQLLGTKPHRITFRKFHSFDSMRTPKHGETRQQPKRLADLDLSAVQRDMADTIERVKAEDPKELQKQVFELKRQLAEAKKSTAVVPQVKEKRVEIPVLKDGQIARLDKLADRFERLKAELVDDGSRLVQEIRDGFVPLSTHFGTMAEKLHAIHNPAPVPTVPHQAPPPVHRVPAPHIAEHRERTHPAHANNGEHEGNKSVSEGYIESLVHVLVNRHPVPTPRAQLAGLAGKSTKSSAFGPNLRELLRRGLAQDTGQGYTATALAVSEYGGSRSAPVHGDAALQHWLGRLPQYESCLLRELARRFPSSLTKEDLADAAGKSLTSSAFGPALRNLINLSFVTDEGGEYRAAEFFFEVAVEAGKSSA